MSLIMAITNTAQSILAGGIVPLTTISRRKGQCINLNSNSITITKPGYYKVSGTVTFTASTAGDVSLELLKNDLAVSGITASGTVTTATTEINTLAIDGIIRVFCNETAVLTLVNTGVAIDTSNVELSIVEV